MPGHILKRTIMIGIAGILGSMAYGQSVMIQDLPLEWSGQSGFTLVNGRTFWNQDWQTGILFMDGTLNPYPQRFGSRFSGKMQPVWTFLAVDSVTYPDSIMMQQRIIYYKGDYNYDQLRVTADFSDPGRLIHLDGFKRTYSSTFGEMIPLVSTSNPNQQAYTLDYHSRLESVDVDASTGIIHTISGIPDSAGFSGLHKDRITTSAVQIRTGWRQWDVRLHGSLFNQRQRIGSTFVPIHKLLTLSRGRVALNLQKSTDSTRWQPEWGVILNTQGLEGVEAQRASRRWMTIAGGAQGKRSRFRIGITELDQQKIVPLLEASMNMDIAGGILAGSLNLDAKPASILTWTADTTQSLEQWAHGHVRWERSAERLKLQLGLNAYSIRNLSYADAFGINDKLGESPGVLHVVVHSQLKLFRRWFTALDYQYWSRASRIGPGYQYYAKWEILGQEQLFSGNMDARLRLWADAWLYPSFDGTLNPYYGGPVNTNIPVDESVVGHIDISATISKVTIHWTVHNILNALAPSIPGLAENAIWIDRHPWMYSMGRLVYFGVDWTFEN